MTFLLAGCAAFAPDGCAGTGAAASITVQLLFGRGLRSGGEIDDAQWADFLAQSVTPRFPDGLTVLDARGQWRQRATGRVIGERSEVVEIVTEQTPDVLARLEAIRAEYRKRFSQESVGLVIEPSCASF